MGTTNPRTKKTRSEVRREYGHPWPWTSRDLFREYVVEPDVTYVEVAEAWATVPDTIRRWAHRHGFDGGGR